DQLWNGQELDQVFVAMSFQESFTERFENVFRPAIENIKVNNVALRAIRVDESKTGDSIITDIIRGIAQARVVLADVSSFGSPADGYNAQRNGNVMYELARVYRL
ncbi:MAG: hypothetical protein ACREXG_07505, partial [Polaromonas sp.]